MYGLNRLKSAKHLFTASANQAPLLRSARRYHSATDGIDNFASVAKISDIHNNYERKMLPPELSRSVVKLQCDSSADGGVCDVYLVGAGGYAESWRQIEGVMQFLKPQVVFLEMCSSREHLLTGKKVKFPTIGEMVDMLKKKQNPFWRLYTCSFSRNEPQLEASDDFRVAYEEAIRNGGNVILGNRPREITLSRYRAKRRYLFGKCSLLFKAPHLPSPKRSMRRATDDTEMAKIVVQAMNKKYPIFTETFIHECDRYMSAKLLEVARQHNSVVAVVGMNHLPGIQKHWKDPVNMDELLRTPTRTRMVKYIRCILLYQLLRYVRNRDFSDRISGVSRFSELQNVVELTCESATHGGLCHVYLVGTEHRSQKSKEEVKALIEFVKPEVVFVELCNERAGLLKDARQGGELYVANEEAIKYGAKVVLGDRDNYITLERFPLMEFLWELLVWRLKLKGIIREIYMSAKLLEVARQHNSVVAVVGKGHLQGIQKNWKEPVDINIMEQLLHTPTRMTMVSHIRDYMLHEVALLPLLDMMVQVKQAESQCCESSMESGSVPDLEREW
ncbi:hypothetical protein OROHE_010810 [Orobanche hederae]